MRYYCSICKKDITKAEFLYSIDKFDRPLCREHQQMERTLQQSQIEPAIDLEVESQTEPLKEETIAEEQQSKFGSLLRKL